MAAEVFTRAFLPEALLPGPRSLSTLPPEATQKPQGIQNKSGLEKIFPKRWWNLVIYHM